MNHARVRSGMMFAAVPPSWMIPWTRQSGGSCWRHRPDAENSAIIASSALRPSHGSLRRVRLEARERRPSTSSDASGWHLDVVAVAGVVQERRVEALEQPVLDHDLLAAPPLLRRACRGTRSRPRTRRGPRPARSPPRPRTPPSCCGRSRARGPAARRTRRGSRSAARPPPSPPASRRGRPSSSAPAGCSTSKPWAPDRLGHPAGRLDAPRTRARGSRGCGATGRGSRPGPPRPRRRRRLRVGERLGGRAGGSVTGSGRSGCGAVSARPRGRSRRR